MYRIDKTGRVVKSGGSKSPKTPAKTKPMKKEYIEEVPEKAEGGGIEVDGSTDSPLPVKMERLMTPDEFLDELFE